MPTAELAVAENVGAVPSADLRSGQLLWATVDSPWVHSVDRNLFLDTVAPLHAMNPDLVFSSHLPAAVNRTEELLRTLAEAPSANAFVGPDQAALEQMLASFEPSPVTVPRPRAEPDQRESDQRESGDPFAAPTRVTRPSSNSPVLERARNLPPRRHSRTRNRSGNRVTTPSAADLRGVFVTLMTNAYNHFIVTTESIVNTP
ncbi:hypothetical protein [Saccharothrix sp. ALI-22-I]|uniref:hypothetical protein n=1 Tax=Saccharothrix sp. ALI-22-I TaxID=1933778 RepID=UPI001EE72188|nr:hypothetical protein [Saccharothrix sp. ALI-22-I]